MENMLASEQRIKGTIEYKMMKYFLLSIIIICFCCGCTQPVSISNMLDTTGHVNVYGTSPNNDIGFDTDDGQVLFFYDAGYMQEEQGRHLRINYTLSGTGYLGHKYINLVSWEVIK
jgi:hypothetical protein